MFESAFPSFLITLREALEAAIIVTIVAAYLKKIGKQRLNRYLHQGAAVAIGVSLVLGAAILAVYGELTGVSVEVFEGVASLIATFVLTYMIFWMARHAQTVRLELERRVEVAVTTGQLIGIVTLSFVAVFREGLETVLFLTTLLIKDSVGATIGLAAASGVVLILSLLLMRGIYRLDIKRFFQATSLILIIFAAGLAGYGVHELIEAGEDSGVDFGVLGMKAFNINPPANPDGSYPLLHEKGAIGSVVAALFGYDGDPEWLRIIVYLGYWLLVGAFVLKSYKTRRSVEEAE